MSISNILFWNVDTQIDFMEPSGKLYVPGAEKIKPTLEKITQFAKDNNIRVINTADYHHINSRELSSNPDYKKRYPPHCMAETKGAEYIKETNPETPAIVDWNKSVKLTSDIKDISKYRNIVIRKDIFDVFEGNQHTKAILKLLDPSVIFVYGVSSNVCVDMAVVGLVKQKRKLFVIKDAIKELPNLPLPYDNWNKLGVKTIDFSEATKIIENLCSAENNN